MFVLGMIVGLVLGCIIGIGVMSMCRAAAEPNDDFEREAGLAPYSADSWQRAVAKFESEQP